MSNKLRLKCGTFLSLEGAAFHYAENLSTDRHCFKFQWVYEFMSKCIYLSNDMYISFKGKVYRFREGVREGGERGMGAAERRIGQDKRGEWNGTERGMAAVICRCSI